MTKAHVYRCPTCKLELIETESWPARPFCSERCKMADLGKWLDGEYVISRPITLEEALDIPIDDA